MRSYHEHSDDSLIAKRLMRIVIVAHIVVFIFTHELICSSPRICFLCKDYISTVIFVWERSSLRKA